MPRRSVASRRRPLTSIYDTLTAATAIEHNLTIVIGDTDFTRVPDLKTLLIPRSEFRR
jgi:predicted nucleic acid-binding protein